MKINLKKYEDVKYLHDGIDFGLKFLPQYLLNRKINESDENKFKVNASLEFLLLCYRKLYQFYLYEKKVKDDFIASDLVPNWNEIIDRENYKKTLNKIIPIEDLHKRHIHLTLNEKKEDWQEVKNIVPIIDTLHYTLITNMEKYPILSYEI